MKAGRFSSGRSSILDACGRYGVGAKPRLDFIFSSLLFRWLLLDSSSSILSSADRSCLGGKAGERQPEPLRPAWNRGRNLRLPLSAASSSPPSARPPPSPRSLLKTCSESRGPPGGLPAHRSGRLTRPWEKSFSLEFSAAILRSAPTQ